MKILKKIVIILLIIIAIPLIVAIFIPKSYTVSVKQTINKPKSVVYEYVRMLDNQKKYSIWVMQDPNMTPEITGVDGTVGATQKWNSTIEDVGEGSQTIVSISEDRMDIDLHFVRPFAGDAKAANILKAIDENTTEITNEFYGSTPYPFNLMAYTFGRSMLTDAMTKNMNNLKKEVESIQ